MNCGQPCIVPNSAMLYRHIGLRSVPSHSLMGERDGPFWPVKALLKTYSMTEKTPYVADFLANFEPQLSERAVVLLQPLLTQVAVSKKQLLVREGTICTKFYWICKGASRSFYLHNGTEVHTWFAFENEVIGSLRSFNELPSRENIESLEDGILIAIDIPGLRSLMLDNLEIMRFVNQTILEYALFMEDKIFDLHMKAAADKFNALLTHQPEVFRRVPLTYIASYLGISRETLSRLRSR